MSYSNEIRLNLYFNNMEDSQKMARIIQVYDIFKSDETIDFDFGINQSLVFWINSKSFNSNLTPEISADLSLFSSYRNIEVNSDMSSADYAWWLKAMIRSLKSSTSTDDLNTTFTYWCAEYLYSDIEMIFHIPTFKDTRAFANTASLAHAEYLKGYECYSSISYYSLQTLDIEHRSSYLESTFLNSKYHFKFLSFDGFKTLDLPSLPLIMITTNPNGEVIEPRFVVDINNQEVNHFSSLFTQMIFSLFVKKNCCLLDCFQNG